MLLHVNQVRHIATNIPQHCHRLKCVGSAAQACKCRLPGKVEHRQIGGRWYMQLHRYLLPVAVPLLGGKVCKLSICGDNTAHSWAVWFRRQVRTYNDHNIISPAGWVRTQFFGHGRVAGRAM